MTSLATALRAEVARLLEPLILAARVDEGWSLVLSLVGHTAQAADDPGLATALADLSRAASEVEAIDDADLGSWAGVQAVLEAADKATTALAQLQGTVSDPDLANRLAGLGEELTAQLVGVYLRRYRSRLFRLAAVLTLIDPAEAHDPQLPVIDGATLLRGSWSADALHFERVGPLLHQPWTTLSAAYFPNDLATASDAHTSAQLLFPLIGAALDELWLPWSVDQRSLSPPVPDAPDGTGADLDHFDTTEPADLPDLPAPPPPGDLDAFWRANMPRLAVRIPQVQADGSLAGTLLDIVVEGSSTEHPGGLAGMIVALTGALNWTQMRGMWTLTATSVGDVPAFVVGPHGMSLASPAAGSSTVELSAVRQPPSGGGPAFVFGSPDGTRLELGSVQAQADLQLAASAVDAALTVMASKSVLVIAPDAGDGFLQKVLPPNGLSAEFDLGIVVSSRRGIELKGGAGLQATLPVTGSLGPFGAVNAIVLAAALHDSQIEALAGADLALRLGPIRVTVDQVGVGTTISFPESGGNLGVANVDLRFAGPKGIGIEIDAKLIRGGGFLRYDEAAGEYAGSLVLSFKGLTIKALGLLNTKAPEPTGWSLLLLLYAEFRETPWQLGLGFNITAVGGIFGLQHIASVEQLRASLGTNAFDDVLFPADPVRDAPRILGRLRTLFPIEPQALTVGPVVEVNWATPPIVVARLAILAQFTGAFGGGNFGFTRLTVLGTVRATAPSATIDAPRLADLTADVLGDYDVESEFLAIDARLRDSKLGGVEFSGSLIVRIGMGRTPAFAIAAGGFHPGFVDLPPAMPARIDRLGLIWKLGDSIVLTLQAYAAVTASSWQLGALFTLRADIGPVKIDGALGFDAIAYDDGRFSVTIGGHVKIRWRDHALMAVSITVTLDRNAVQVWHAAGTAKFSVLWWDKEVDFEHTWGTERSLPPATPVDAAALVRAGLAEPGNWTSQLPAGGESLVALTDPQRAPGPVPVRVLAHPLGTLTVTQRVAPLGLRLDHVDGAPVASGTIVEIGPVRVGPAAAAAATRLTTQLFARARFQELSESERLTQKTFEAFPAGVTITPEGQANPVGAVTDFDFERIFLAPDSVKKPPPAKSFPGQPSWHLRTGPASRSPLRGAGRLVRGLHVRDVAVGPSLVVLVGDRDLAEAAQLSDEEARSATLARQRLRAGQLVVEAHEVGV